LLEFAVIGIPSFALALERTCGPIRGNFMRSILMPALIAGAVAVVNIAIISLVRRIGWFGIGREDYLTLSILSVTLTGYMMLVKMCLPLTRYRFTVLASVACILLLAFFVVPGFLGMSDLIAEQVLLLMLLAFASYNLLMLLNKLILRNRDKKESSLPT